MPNLINMERIQLKNNPQIKEDMIQKYLFDNPTVLGLGDLTPIQREKIQPSGGRLDLLFASDSATRYEVEVQLGATDPSHIIRTIEYWDTERKRYPQYDHCAVIIAEEITGRFMNVISLFNGNIPLIAIQLSAYKTGNDISLAFTKIIDRITLGEDDNEFEVTDRNYWEKRSTPAMMKNVDTIFSELSDYMQGCELKYNKFYIGLSKDGMVRNFVEFKPKKNFLYFITKGNKQDEIIEKLENAGFDVGYTEKWKEYSIRINKLDDFLNNKDLMIEIVKISMEYYNIND